MDLYLLRYFTAVVEAGSFTRAADRCFVTQPTLSAGIKKLEEQLGSPLFERSNRRVYLTDSGTRFLPHARAILHETNLARESLKDSGRPVLRLGALRTLDPFLIQALITRFRALHPDVMLDLIEGSEQEISNRLSERSVDIALLLDRGLYDRQAKVMEEPYVFILSAVHPLSGRKKLDADDLAEEPMIVRRSCELLSETSRFFTDQNRRPRLAYRTENDQRAVAMVEAGLGGTVVPQSLVREGVSVFALKGFSHRRTIVSVIADREFSDPLAQMLPNWSDVALSYLP